MREAFGPLLRMFRERAGRSRNSLCLEAGCNPSYGVRLESGEREPPRLDFVMGFARALRLNTTDRNRLLIAAGFSPVELATVSWSGALQSVADVLSDPFLSVEEKDIYSSVIQQVSERWRGAGVGLRVGNGVEVHST